MNEQTRDNLIATIRKSIPEEINLTTYLSDTLNIGRESAYRRIRGEINFTFEEVAALSQNLGFSIDNMIGVKHNENALFNIHMLQNMDYRDIYRNKMLEYGRLFGEASQEYTTHARISINTLPYFFHTNYEQISRLRIYKWLYQNQKISPSDKFSDFILPEKIWDAHRIFHKEIQKVQNVTVIMDNNVFQAITQDIEYFFKRKLLSNSDLQLLQKDLYDIADMLEQMATNGRNRGGAKMEMYVSLVDLEASYLHFEYGDNQFSQIKIFSISAIDSFDKGLCNIQRTWIESQKRYSVLISESGEMQRFEYLNNQRAFINQLSKLIAKG